MLAIDLRWVLCALVGLPIGGFYSYYWRLVPRYLAGLMMLLGVAGTVVLILFLATPGIPFQGDGGRLIVRMGVTTLVMLALLAVYGEAWKRVCASLCDREGPERAAEQADPGDEDGHEALARGILPAAQVETGFWLFFGFMLVADLLSATT